MVTTGPPSALQLITVPLDAKDLGVENVVTEPMIDANRSDIDLPKDIVVPNETIDQGQSPMSNLNVPSGDGSPQNAPNPTLIVPVPIEKKVSHQAILLNVDSTILKLEESNMSTESV